MQKQASAPEAKDVITSGTRKRDATPAIEIDGLTKRFGQVLAVDQLSFAVPRGTITGFLGPNGAGKTTTLRMLLGLVEPTKGTATIDGRPYVQLTDPLRHVGAVLEASSFYPGRTARNHLRVQATAGGIDAARVDAVLELTALAGDWRQCGRGRNWTTRGPRPPGGVGQLAARRAVRRLWPCPRLAPPARAASATWSSYPRRWDPRIR